jgi:hypothetical protein
MAFKATPSAHRTPRHIALEKNAAAGFDGPGDATYDARGGAPRGAAGLNGDYSCNVQDTITQTPKPSKSLKSPIK